MINVELSSIWSCVSLPQLLACEKDLFDAHLHLRSNQPGAPEFLGWLGQPDAVTAKTIHAIRKACETISGQCDTLVVAGSGEGYLAAKAGVEMLGGRYRNLLDSRMRIVFTGDSLASSDWIALCRLLEGREFCLLLLSSEGAELEMCTASRALRWLMERRYGQGAKQRVYVSALPESPLAVMAKEEGFTYLPMAQCLAGGVSALNAGTLLVLAAAGIDPLGVLEGAAEGFSQYDLRAFENPVWMYAGARYALTQKGRSTECLGCFTPDFGAFGAWWQQYFLRHTCREGAGAMPVYLPLPSALDAMDTVAQGKDQRVFETLLQVPERCFQKVNIEMDWKDYDGLGYLTDTTLEDVAEKTLDAFVESQAAADVPVILLECDALDAPQAGELLYFFELANAICAAASGVDPLAPMQFGPARTLAGKLLGKLE